MSQFRGEQPNSRGISSASFTISAKNTSHTDIPKRTYIKADTCYRLSSKRIQFAPRAKFMGKNAVSRPKTFPKFNGYQDYLNSSINTPPQCIDGRSKNENTSPDDLSRGFPKYKSVWKEGLFGHDLKREPKNFQDDRENILEGNSKEEEIKEIPDAEALIAILSLYRNAAIIADSLNALNEGPVRNRFTLLGLRWLHTKPDMPQKQVIEYELPPLDDASMN